MRTRRRMSFPAAVGALLMMPSLAHGQYKNQAFGLDAGYWFITKPTTLDDEGNLLSADKRPLRLANGYRIGGEGSFKMDQDHWWFVARLNIAFLQYGVANDYDDPDEETFDREAKEKLGTLMGVDGQIGVRYYIFTDRVRPYLQVGLSYMRLFSFSSSADQSCVTGICGEEGGAGTYGENYLPHPNVGALRFQPGLEMILTRDVALHLFVDASRFMILNAADNYGILIGLGGVFYT